MVRSRAARALAGSEMRPGLLQSRGRLAVLAVLPLLGLTGAGVDAQEYPNKPLRWIVPFPPGGSVDAVARRIGPALAAQLGQQVVLDNRTGASGNIAAELVARSAPDGYTLMNHTVPFVVNTFLYRRVPYDPLQDFVPVSLLGTTNSVMTVHPSLPVRNVRDLIAMARAKPGALHYGSAGIGTNPHICGELLNYLAKIDLVVVHFKGGGPARMAVIGGELPISFNSVLETAPQVKAKRLRAIAVTGTKRAAALPDIPTMAESGVPGYEFLAWHGLLAPKGTPAAIVNTLRDRIKVAVGTADVVRQLEDQGLDLVLSSPAEFGAYLKSEVSRWGPVVKERGMRAD